MLSFWKVLRNRQQGNRVEGFTLLELIVVVIIIGMLTAFAIPAFANQERVAIVATVKSDVSANRTDMIGGKNGLYKSVTDFMSSSVSTAGNERGYAVNSDNSVACEWSFHQFSVSDIVIYHFLSTDGVIEKGACPALNSVPSGEQGEGGGGGTDVLQQMPGLIFTEKYAPQNNSLNFCYTINIKIDPNYAHKMNPPEYTWVYKIDLSSPPFWGLNPNTDLNSVYGYKTVSVNSNVWTIGGEGWNDTVTNSTPRTVGFCTTQVPTPPLDPTTYSYTVVPSSANTNWWACVDFTVTSKLVYPTPWQIVVNLDQFFKSFSGKTSQFINLIGTKTSGDTYTVTGIGWNQYVALSMPRTYSASICYSPNGSAW